MKMDQDMRECPMQQPDTDQRPFESIADTQHDFTLGGMHMVNALLILAADKNRQYMKRRYMPRVWRDWIK